MFPVYEEKKENLHFRSKTSRHASPHLHNSIEFIYYRRNPGAWDGAGTVSYG